MMMPSQAPPQKAPMGLSAARVQIGLFNIIVARGRPEICHPIVSLKFQMEDHIPKKSSIQELFDYRNLPDASGAAIYTYKSIKSQVHLSKESRQRAA